ncbi:hypothetical protein J4214_05665 [Candidatus Woesearchaeota archaeon]|nr:hypothetical protein [Candidatus Woesearchaeota archaeon]
MGTDYYIRLMPFGYKPKPRYEMNEVKSVLFRIVRGLSKLGNFYELGKLSESTKVANSETVLRHIDENFDKGYKKYKKEGTGSLGLHCFLFNLKDNLKDVIDYRNYKDSQGEVLDTWGYFYLSWDYEGNELWMTAATHSLIEYFLQETDKRYGNHYSVLKKLLKKIAETTECRKIALYNPDSDTYHSSKENFDLVYDASGEWSSRKW